MRSIACGSTTRSSALTMLSDETCVGAVARPRVGTIDEYE